LQLCNLATFLIFFSFILETFQKPIIFASA
jgi:hypothetical protein